MNEIPRRIKKVLRELTGMADDINLFMFVIPGLTRIKYGAGSGIQFFPGFLLPQE